MYNAKKTKQALACSYFAIVVSCICALIQLYALPRDMNAWVSLSNRALMILWVIFVGFAVLKKVEQHYPAKLAGGLVLVVFSVASYFISSVDTSSLAVSMGLKLLGFLILPLMLLYSAVFRIDSRAKTTILLFNLAASLIFIDLYYSDKRYLYEGGYGNVNLDVITLGYSNPNRTAMYLFLCIVSLVVGAFYFKLFLVKVIFAADAAYMAWFLWQTGARAGWLLLVAFLALVWFAGKKRIPNAWVTIALLIPAFYLLILPLSSGMTVMGEALFNGREAVYDRYFGSLTVNSFLVGDMDRFQFDNLHNGYVAIAASVGVPACVGYIHLLKTCMINFCPQKTAPAFERVAFVGFLCAVMYTGAEAAFFVGGSTYAMLVFAVFLLFAKTYSVKDVEGNSVAQTSAE